MFYLYAYTVDREDNIVDVAEAGQFDTEEEAMQSADVQRQCYSDDGIFFVVGPELRDPEPNIDYFHLIQQNSK